MFDFGPRRCKMLESQGQITHVILAPNKLFQLVAHSESEEPKGSKRLHFSCGTSHTQQSEGGYTCCREALRTPRSWQAKQVNHGKIHYIYMIYEICDWNFKFTSWQKLWWTCPRGKPAGEYILIDAPLGIKWRNTFYCTETAFCWTERRIAFCKVQRC